MLPHADVRLVALLEVMFQGGYVVRVLPHALRTLKCAVPEGVDLPL